MHPALITLIVIASIAILAVLVTIPSRFVITKQKTATIIESWGKFDSVRTAGLSFKRPWPFTEIAGEVNLKLRELSVNVTVKSSDNAFLDVPVKIQYRILEDKVREAFYELEDAVGRKHYGSQEGTGQIGSYVVNVVRSQASGMTMDKIFESKEDIGTAVSVELRTRFADFGYEVENVLVDDPQPSEKLRVAFDKVLASKRDLEAAENDAEAKRVRMVGEAKAEAESLELKAASYVKQRKTIVEGMGEALGDDNGISGISNDRILRYLEGIDLRDTIRDASSNEGSVIVIPADMGNEGLSRIAAMHSALPGNGDGNGAEPTA